MKAEVITNSYQQSPHQICTDRQSLPPATGSSNYPKCKSSFWRCDIRSAAVSFPIVPQATAGCRMAPPVPRSDHTGSPAGNLSTFPAPFRSARPRRSSPCEFDHQIREAGKTFLEFRSGSAESQTYKARAVEAGPWHEKHPVLTREAMTECLNITTGRHP